jgi:UDP-N-acetylglucosamine:LPS N-acetylglucosamine transferase
VRDGSQTDPVALVIMFAQLLFIVLKFRPSTIVTTGAAPGVFAVRLGKLLGARTVWIDSIANSEELSLSGRLVRKHVDLCLTQWPHLTDAYPDVQCFGSVI